MILPRARSASDACTDADKPAIFALGHGIAFLFALPFVGIEILAFDVESESLVRDAAGRCVRVTPGEPGELVVKISERSRFEGYTDSEASEKKVLRDGLEDGDVYLKLPSTRTARARARRARLSARSQHHMTASAPHARATKAVVPALTAIRMASMANITRCPAPTAASA